MFRIITIFVTETVGIFRDLSIARVLMVID
jgi:hypothetical protein